MKCPVSVVVLTHNEEIHIGRLMENLAGWADEVFVVDSFSADKTLETAGKYGAKIFQHPFENQAQQFNWALDNLKIKNDWILRLDADEYLTEELKEEISKILEENFSISLTNINGYYIKRRVYFMGRWIKHGGYYPTWLLRLFRKGKARSERREMDEHLVLLEGESGKLKNDFIDDNRKGLAFWADKHNKFSSRESEDVLKARGVSWNEKGGLIEWQAARKRWLKTNFYYRLPPFFRAFLYWFYRYFIRLGFLDGREGLIFHFLQGFWYRFLVDAKLYEFKKENKK